MPVYTEENKSLPAISKDQYNTMFESGTLAWLEVCGANLRLIGREKDEEQFIDRLLLSFSKFVNLRNYMPFLELIRGTIKKQKVK